MVPLLLKTPTNAPHWRHGVRGALIGPAALYGGIRAGYESYRGYQQLGYIFAATLFSLFGLLFCGSATRA